MIIRPVILLAISGTLLLLVVRRMRSQRLKERHALVFIFMAIPFLILAVWPVVIERVSEWLGISTYTVMLLGVSVFLILMIFELLTIVSVLDRKISTLAQMVGILNEKLQLMERRRDGDLSDHRTESFVAEKAEKSRPRLPVRLPRPEVGDRPNGGAQAEPVGAAAGVSGELRSP